jgi:septal ring factor EnvC (AmiA/AmiB activator)
MGKQGKPGKLQGATDMTGANKALMVVLIVATLGLWGCAQNPTGSATSARIRDLEARTAKLEEDYRAAASARDQLRKRLTATEEQRVQGADKLQVVTRERDELKQQINVRGAERDALHGQLLQIGKDLQSLAGRIEAATGTTLSPPVAAARND